ncbi:MAG: Na+/H+ antiporter subunit E [Nitrospirota bacterium]|jgi:multicomponent Na+:H+ antiporter subunit E
MASFIVTTAIMYVFWILLSGYFDFFHLFSGLLCSLLVAHFSHDLLIGEESKIGRGFKKFARFLAYLPWLFYQIFKANVDVAWLTLHPRLPIDPKIIHVKTSLRTEMGIVTFANSITLTPGTVTVAASHEGEFMVHVIAPDSASLLESGEMARRVESIEGEDV